MINIEHFDSNKENTDEKSHKKIIVEYIGYVTQNNVKPLYLIINKINGYVEENNWNIYLTVVPADRKQRYFEELWRSNRMKLEILLDQQAIIQMIMIRNIWKSNLMLVTVYF